MTAEPLPTNRPTQMYLVRNTLTGERYHTDTIKDLPEHVVVIGPVTHAPRPD